MAKKPMGINGVFGGTGIGGTGMEALAAATGAIVPAAPDLHVVPAPAEEAPVTAAPIPAAPIAAPTPATAKATAERHIATNVRLRADQWEALRREALDRALARRGGKADASEVLREVIDVWLESRRQSG